MKMEVSHVFQLSLGSQDWEGLPFLLRKSWVLELFFLTRNFLLKKTGEELF